MLVFLVLSGLGNPARTSSGTGATDEAVAALSAEMGLDRPLVVQYWDWASGVLHGDFGISYISNAPIGPQIADRLQVTLWLVLGAMVVALLIAVPLGMISALRHGRPAGYLLSGALADRRGRPGLPGRDPAGGGFAVGLGWLPANGYVVPGDRSRRVPAST